MAARGSTHRGPIKIRKADGTVVTAIGADGLVGGGGVSDGAVTTAKIAAQAVTLAKLARGTNGQLIVGATGADPAYRSVTGDISIDTNGLTAIGPGKVVSAMVEETLIRYAAVSLTAAQIKALRASPFQLVAAPGGGKALEFVSAILLLDAGTEVLAESAANLAVRYDNGTGVIVSQTIESTGFIDQAVDTLTGALPKIDAIAAKTASENKALVLHNTGAGEFTGNASNDALLRVKVAYRVHTTGW